MQKLNDCHSCCDKENPSHKPKTSSKTHASHSHAHHNSNSHDSYNMNKRPFKKPRKPVLPELIEAENCEHNEDSSVPVTSLFFRNIWMSPEKLVESYTIKSTCVDLMDAQAQCSIAHRAYQHFVIKIDAICYDNTAVHSHFLMSQYYELSATLLDRTHALKETIYQEITEIKEITSIWISRWRQMLASTDRLMHQDLEADNLLEITQLLLANFIKSLDEPINKMYDDEYAPSMIDGKKPGIEGAKKVKY